MNSLVKFWSTQKFLKPPYIHSEDVEILRQFPTTSSSRSHKAFLKSEEFGIEGDLSFHTSLLPVPYQGDLNNADIFIVLLNPGFGLSDYYTQDNKPHSKALRKIIQQDMKGIEYPFLSLDPEFSWSGGFYWWEKKLRRILQLVAKERCRDRYLDALKLLSRRMAAIEIVPYHSRGFGSRALIEKLPSAVVAKKFIEHDLVKKAKKGELTLVITRQATLFDLPKDCKDIVVYEGRHARGASLGPETRGGSAMVRRILER